MKLIIKLPLLGSLAAALLYVTLMILLRGKSFPRYAINISNYMNVSSSKMKNTTVRQLSAKSRPFTVTVKTKLKDSVLRVVLPTKKPFIATREQLFPPDPSFTPSEMGDCINNGDSQMKSLSRTCGCPPEAHPSPLHRCCEILMLKLMKDVFNEMIKADIPFILTGGAVEGWLYDKKLKPNDLDINAGVPYTIWNSQQYTDILKRLASRGYCVWFRNSVWTKIWTSVIPVDIRPWSVVDNQLYFAGSPKSLDVSNILPKQLAVLEGMHVFIPNKPKEYLNQLHGIKPFVATAQQVFPRDPLFRSTEIGNCVDNGDADMKKLSKTCDCPPEEPAYNVHSCCRPHLLKLLKDVYREMFAADIPMILTGGAVIGWYRNKKLVPYDKDIDAGLLLEHWKSPQYTAALKRLAARGLCVWFRTPTWTKVWSGPFAFDMFALNIVDGELYFYSPKNVHNPYNISIMYPKRVDVLEGVQVFLPNQPKGYLDHYLGEGKWLKPLH